MTNPIDNFFNRLAMEDRQVEDCETFERRKQAKQLSKARKQEREIKQEMHEER